MTTNEIRYYLHNYDKLKCEILLLSGALKEYRLMDGVKAKTITKMPIMRATTSKTESSVLTKMEYIAELEDTLDRLMRVNIAIGSVYCYLSEPARTIIEMRYFITPQPHDVRQRKYNWMEIADEVGKTEPNCRKIDERIIRMIQGRISFDARI